MSCVIRQPFFRFPGKNQTVQGLPRLLIKRLISKEICENLSNSIIFVDRGSITTSVEDHKKGMIPIIDIFYSNFKSENLEL